MKLNLKILKNKTNQIIAVVLVVAVVAGSIYFFMTRNTVRMCRSKYGLCPAAK